MRIIVTDLTRFKNPDIVCLAGIEPGTGRCVRPMIPVGQNLQYLPFATAKNAKIIPGSCLQGNFVPVPGAAAPHVEDCRSEGALQVVGSASGEEFEAVLQQSAKPTIREAFGTRPVNRLYPPGAVPGTSLATLRLASPADQFRLVADDKFGAAKFKAHITDGEGFALSWVPVTDLGFSDHIKAVLATDPNLSKLNSFLQSQTTLYLRIGLGRQYAASATRDGYWVQLNGIYSFPSFRTDLRVYD